MARRFNGTSDYIEHGAAVVSALPITMACWFYNAQHPIGVSWGLTTIGDSAASSRVQLYLSETTLRAITVSTVPSGAEATVDGLKVNQWQHGCGVWASTTDRRVFLNGRKGTNATSIVLGTPTATTFGARYSSGVRGSFMNGLIDKAAIWNVALDDSEVYLLSRGYYPDQIRRGNLVAYWDMEGQYSPNEIDRIGRFDGVVNGAKSAIADYPPMLPRMRRHSSLRFAHFLELLQFARPDSDITPGSWTASTGNDLFAMVDEVDADDADRIRSNTGSGDDAVTLGLSDITEPEAGTVNITIRHRLGT